MEGAQYAQALAGEGEYWDSFIAQRLLAGQIPGSVDWRLACTQFRFNHGWRPLSLGPQLVNFRMREIGYVLASAAPRPGMRVLDLGCGAGWLGLELARRGAHVTGLDISPTNLALARYMAETNARNFPYLYQGFVGLPCKLEDFGSAEYAYADLNTVSLPSREYDAVVVWDSLHHIQALERLMEQVRAALKPGGVFIGVDHAFATPRTEEFNRAVMPWLDDFYAWVKAADPEWLYDAVSDAARRYDWGVLGIDRDPTPVPGWEPFQEQLLAEMLDIVRNSLRQEALDKAPDMPPPVGRPQDTQDGVQESPFEDVSAERLMRVLLEEFQAARFETVCPLIMPEKHVPLYRTEKERIFQHYLSAVLIRIGKRAVERGQADGQWFLFHMTPARPSQSQAGLAP